MIHYRGYAVRPNAGLVCDGPGISAHDPLVSDFECLIALIPGGLAFLRFFAASLHPFGGLGLALESELAEYAAAGALTSLALVVG
jgi:hypothetical protein